MTTNEKMCPNCRKMFLQKHKRHTYCSYECKYAYTFKSVAVHEERNCIRCGKKFISKNGKQQFCSRKCERAENHGSRPDLMRRGNIFTTEEARVERVRAKTSRIEYISDWDGKFAYFMCKDCGMIFRHSVGFTKPSAQKNISCPNCVRILSEMREKQIQKEKEILKQKKLEEKRRRESKKPEKQIIFRTCAMCGTIFFPNGKQKYCSDKCRSAVLWKKRELYRYKVPLDKLYIRDNGICHICGIKCDWNDKSINEQGYIVYGDNYPSRDHIIEKCRGGEHSWENIKLAHRKCNTERWLNYDTEEKRRIKEKIC